jgi:hypothetical protein
MARPSALAKVARPHSVGGYVLTSPMRAEGDANTRSVVMATPFP